MGEKELWLIFLILIAAILVYDFLISDRKAHDIKTKRAAIDVIAYISIATIFGLLIFLEIGQDQATQYYAQYIIEFAMSVDNLFVFILIFATFSIPAANQHRVLFYGIAGAIVFRAVFVFVGQELLNSFDWMFLIFGAILVVAAVKTTFGNDEKDAEDSLAFRLANRMKSADGPAEGKFFTRVNGKLIATSMFLCLITIELSDIIFAFDSVPAALSITTDIFPVFTSNIFAVMGLRSLYFLLNKGMNSIAYLKYGLGVILAFIGIKLFLSYFEYEISVINSLVFIAIVLIITTVASKIATSKKAEA